MATIAAVAGGRYTVAVIAVAVGFAVAATAATDGSAVSACRTVWLLRLRLIRLLLLLHRVLIIQVVFSSKTDSV